LNHLAELDPTRAVVVYCAGGYRSSVAASLLRAHGFDRVADILGGFDAWRSAHLPVEHGHTEMGNSASNGS
jgi:hydroxyacylglutathione hydrolase